MKTTIAVLVLVAVIVAFTSRGGNRGNAAEFVFVDRADIITLDINQMSYMQDFRLTYAFREGLFSLEPKTFKTIPAGCVRFDVSPDSRVYTYHLRPHSQWSNGDPITADDYVFSWRRMLEDPGDYTSLFYYIRNAEAYQKAYADRLPFDMSTLGFKALDKNTLQVTLGNPVAYLADLMAFPPFYPRHERSMARFRTIVGAPAVMKAFESDATPAEEMKTLTAGEVLDRLATYALNNPLGMPSASPPTGKFDSWQAADQLKFMVTQKRLMFEFDPTYTRPPYVVSNGAFTLDEWRFKSKLRLKKSETYWDKANVALGSIEMQVNENPLSQYLQFKAGAVDWLCECPSDIAPELFEKKDPNLRLSVAYGTSFLNLLTSEKFPPSILGGAKNPLADVRVRQALAMSIDKAFIVDQITRMGEKQATTYFPPGTLPGFDLLPGLDFDVVKAKALLAEAGYPDGVGFPQLPILYGTNNKKREKIVQYLKQQWKKNLNIELDIQGVEGKTFSKRMTDREYAIAPTAWYGDYPDVSTFTDKYLSTSINNNSAWFVKEYDDLCAAAAREPDKAKRLLMLRKAENMIDTQVPVIPLYHDTTASLYPDKVTGVEANPRNLIVWKAVKVAK